MKELKSLGVKTKYEWKNEPQPELLETFENKHSKTAYLIPFIQDRDEFTSLCPRTGQPDHARMEIIYIPNDLCVESKSLKLYLMSFRQSGEFHEDVCNRIADDLFKLLDSFYLRVYGNFCSRGSLAIKPMIVRRQEDLHPEDVSFIKDLVKTWDIKK